MESQNLAPGAGVEGAPQKCLVILNPAARSERARRVWFDAFPESRSVEVAFTEAPGHARDLARRAAADGYSLVVAAGGDGTVNEVANGIAGTQAVLGVVPLGSVNVLARELGIPQRVNAAWKVVASGVPRRIDLGRVVFDGGRADAGPRHFVQLAGAGLDAEAVRQVTRVQKRIWGPLSYVFSGLRVAAAGAPRIRLVVDGRESAEGVCAIFGNGRLYGGPFAVLKHAVLDDGLLDVCVFERGDHLSLFNYVQGVVRGAHTGFRDVRYFQGRNIRVEAAAAAPVEIDGEMAGFLPVEIQSVPQALSVMVPQPRLAACQS